MRQRNTQREREREREGETDRQTDRDREADMNKLDHCSKHFTGCQSKKG